MAVRGDAVVWASSTKVVIRNYWRSYELAWADVTDVSAAPSLGRSVGGWIFRLQSGRRIKAYARPMNRDFGEGHRLVAAAGTPVTLHQDALGPPDDQV